MSENFLSPNHYILFFNNYTYSRLFYIDIVLKREGYKYINIFKNAG